MEHRITHFADNITLTLDGSQMSLQADLNIIEIIDYISVFKMKTEKKQTNMIRKSVIFCAADWLLHFFLGTDLTYARILMKFSGYV